MNRCSIEPLRPDLFDAFVDLIVALADYEKLPPPDAAARARLYSDAFEQNPPRYQALLARKEMKCAVTVCISRPTLRSLRSQRYTSRTFWSYRAGVAMESGQHS